MYIVAIAWMFVVVLMAAAEAVSSVGSVLGAFITLLLYGLLPLSIVLYVMGTPIRRRARLAAEARTVASAAAEIHPTNPSTLEPDGGGHAAGDAVAAERKEA